MPLHRPTAARATEPPPPTIDAAADASRDAALHAEAMAIYYRIADENHEAMAALAKAEAPVQPPHDTADGD